MASGDAVNSGPTSVAAGAYLTIQPGAGVEWIVHNLKLPDGTISVEIYDYDGTNSILLGTATSSWLTMNFHLTNAKYMRMKNITAAAVYLAYDGIVVK